MSLIRDKFCSVFDQRRIDFVYDQRWIDSVSDQRLNFSISNLRPKFFVFETILDLRRKNSVSISN